MKNIHIQNSYKIWRKKDMLGELSIRLNMLLVMNNRVASSWEECSRILLNRPLFSMYIEWWLHNIGYYLTLPFCWIKKFKSWNERCKHVDLEEWK